MDEKQTANLICILIIFCLNSAICGYLLGRQFTLFEREFDLHPAVRFVFNALYLSIVFFAGFCVTVFLLNQFQIKINL